MAALVLTILSYVKVGFETPYLDNQKVKREVKDILETIQTGRPTIKLAMMCYHTVDRRGTDNEKERIITHSMHVFEIQFLK